MPFLSPNQHRVTQKKIPNYSRKQNMLYTTTVYYSRLVHVCSRSGLVHYKSSKKETFWDCQSKVVYRPLPVMAPYRCRTIYYGGGLVLHASWAQSPTVALWHCIDVGLYISGGLVLSYVRHQTNSVKAMNEQAVRVVTQYAPTPLSPCGRLAPLSRWNVAVLSQAKYVPTLTAAATFHVKAALSKAAWWPSDKSIV